MSIGRKPDWLKVRLASGIRYGQTAAVVREHRLHTICSSGKCPNIGECWSLGTATFLLLGDVCTRSCKFCATRTGKPLPLDEEEPGRVAESVRLMQLTHCVLTSVDRDDLPDGGATHWVRVIREVRDRNPGLHIEVLLPDFKGCVASMEQIVEVSPEVVGHNLETISRLTPGVRSGASYQRSLAVLRFYAGAGQMVKSGLMLGLGETYSEVLGAMEDLLDTGCRLLTLGQYLQPGPDLLPVVEYIHPEVFEELGQRGREMGFLHVESAPLVRSSYMAEKAFCAIQGGDHA